MVIQLRNVRKTRKLGGKGKFTEDLAKKLSTFNGLSIRRNMNGDTDVKKAVMATFHHMISTDDNPHHKNCPEGEVQ
ncbi:hypothetical protein HHI36_006511, partial [Cryptolaemus montrouzieri]